jgi:hypothetical protein
MKSLTFDGFEIPMAEGGTTFRTNFADAVPRTERLPLLDGGFDNFGTRRAPQEIGLVSVSFYLVADTPAEMQEKRDEVAGLMWRGKKLLKWVPADGMLERYCYARINGVNMTQRADDDDCIQQVTINWQVSDPRWLVDEDDVVEAVSGTSSTFTVTNNGSMYAVPKITIACGAAQAVTTVTVQRLDGVTVLDEVKYDAAIGNNQSLVIDVGEHSVKLDGADAYSADFTFENAAWFELAPGENSIKVVLDASGAATVTFEYASAYV